MKKQNELYIGWQEKMPESNRRFLKKVLIPLFILIPILVFAVVFFQKPFNNHKFEFGKSTLLNGTYFSNPVPMFIVDKKSALPDSISHDLILVGYGKFGAKGIIQNIEKNTGDLNGKRISITGTVIHGDGKALMELTEQENSFVKIIDEEIVQSPTSSQYKEASFSGEIIDPKCYFGVMKPGEGKIHKSCAIRCISGGIPPILKVKTGSETGSNQYYILLDEKGQEINKAVLPYVAENITISGKTNRLFNWDVLYINIDDLPAALK